jgi:hypothetical protein
MHNLLCTNIKYLNECQGHTIGYNNFYIWMAS